MRADDKVKVRWHLLRQSTGLHDLWLRDSVSGQQSLLSSRLTAVQSTLKEVGADLMRENRRLKAVTPQTVSDYPTKDTSHAGHAPFIKGRSLTACATTRLTFISSEGNFTYAAEPNLIYRAAAESFSPARSPSKNLSQRAACG